jgi:hypothetical protein
VGGICRIHREIRNVYNIFLGNLKGEDHSTDKVINGRIILKRILGQSGLEVWFGFIWLRIGTSGRLL